ncbi:MULTISPECIES: hypothetical protein [Dermacoccus]|uniref:hypothetical protein n=1 Tax=Dermacoccus TaxID=57495 RepID=UPI000EBAE05E|nr:MULTISPECIES: hypothetical protein [Dermacoccus]MCG7430720.1 hypothetical protein [Dermacoccus nishinomiyaensis]MCT1603500.1 hypothetical protein [Dermacoccus nishinomiyaensis]HCQ19144.1 hypothetical protein [Dermacoccus sp.]
MSQAIGETTVRHQRVGSLELFCDLVFVVAIERLTHLLHGDPGRALPRRSGSRCSCGSRGST